MTHFHYAILSATRQDFSPRNEGLSICGNSSVHKKKNTVDDGGKEFRVGVIETKVTRMNKQTFTQ